MPNDFGQYQTEIDGLNILFTRVSAGFPLLGGDQTRRHVEQFMLAFDSDLAPIVGQQVTLTIQNASAVGARIALPEQRAGTPFTSRILGGTVTECDLVARVVRKVRNC